MKNLTGETKRLINLVVSLSDLCGLLQGTLEKYKLPSDTKVLSVTGAGSQGVQILCESSEFFEVCPFDPCETKTLADFQLNGGPNA